MVGISLVLIGLLSTGGNKLFRTYAQSLLLQHPMAPCLPGIQPLLNHLMNCLGCGYVTGLLYYHCLEDDEPLQVKFTYKYLEIQLCGIR